MNRISRLHFSRRGALLKNMRVCVLFLLSFFLLVIPAHSETAYITDDIRVMLRSDEGMDRRIIAMPKSGTQVEVLEKLENGWSKVRLPDEKEGWLLTRYLNPGPPREEVVAKLKSENEALRQQAKTLIEENARLKRERNDLREALSKQTKTVEAPRKSYETLKKGSSGLLSLKPAYEKAPEDLATKTKRQAKLEEKPRALQGGEHYDFRKTKWGMWEQEVQATESLEPAYQKQGILGYKSKLLQKNVLIMYIFVEGKLVRAQYILAERHTNRNAFIQDYEDFKEILTTKYGKPDNDSVYWLNDLYKDEHSRWGFAVSLGHLKYFSSWNTDSTKIVCALHGENYDITCAVEYTSKKLEHLEQEKKDKEAMDAL